MTAKMAKIEESDLLREYDRARKRTDAYALYTALAAPERKCRYCGNHRIPWAGSKLDGHAKCIVDASFKHFVGMYLSRHDVTIARVAELLNLSTAVVRSWSRR